MAIKRFVLLGTIGIVISLLVACSPSSEVTQVALEPTPMIFSHKGPYHVGTRRLSFYDANRDGRYVGITVWYPAIQPADTTSKGPTSEAAPEVNSAPYPLILSDTKVAKIFAPYLVSHGFVWASVDRIDTYYGIGQETIDQPLDILFALEQVTSSPPQGLEGMINSEQVGVTGYSFGGLNTLFLSGARFDPECYLAHCLDPKATLEPLAYPDFAFYHCGPAREWDEFTAYVGEAITTSEDGMWQAMTDERIHAVIPMAAGEGWQLFGERGLAAVDRPVMIIVGTEDELYWENGQIYEHVGTPDKAMISFIGDGHMVMVMDYVHIARIAHFMTAFFGYHLQGHEDYAIYFSEDFVGQYDDLFWGVYEE